MGESGCSMFKSMSVLHGDENEATIRADETDFENVRGLWALSCCCWAISVCPSALRQSESAQNQPGGFQKHTEINQNQAGTAQNKLQNLGTNRKAPRTYKKMTRTNEGPTENHAEIPRTNFEVAFLLDLGVSWSVLSVFCFALAASTLVLGAFPLFLVAFTLTLGATVFLFSDRRARFLRRPFDNIQTNRGSERGR